MVRPLCQANNMAVTLLMPRQTKGSDRTAPTKKNGGGKGKPCNFVLFKRAMVHDAECSGAGSGCQDQPCMHMAVRCHRFSNHAAASPMPWCHTPQVLSLWRGPPTSWLPWATPCSSVAWTIKHAMTAEQNEHVKLCTLCCTAEGHPPMGICHPTAGGQ